MSKSVKSILLYIPLLLSQKAFRASSLSIRSTKHLLDLIHPILRRSSRHYWLCRWWWLSCNVALLLTTVQYDFRNISTITWFMKFRMYSCRLAS
ncbi:hypothetical protein MKW98_025252 [Papaver atlanticum]|uniref:Uncharacterized protein n=1 Tax=Papaver atlanticum TaxID=357466 RepID=A0AAD4X7M1_9MAGN|nr:hypothetical protein MKW98_025252 [Papaver atlanticum]